MRLLILVVALGAAVGCEKKKQDAPVPAPVVETAPAAAPKTNALPRPCNDYKVMIERLSRCDKLPVQSRDALRQGFEAMEQGWKNAGDLPPESFKALSDGCAAGTAALRQAAEAMCPPDTFKVERESP